MSRTVLYTSRRAKATFELSTSAADAIEWIWGAFLSKRAETLACERDFEEGKCSGTQLEGNGLQFSMFLQFLTFLNKD